MHKAAAFGLLSAILTGQARSFAQTPEPIGENLLRLEGTDRGSGIHYLKLISLLAGPGTPPHASPDALPRFTVECREHAGKRTLHWLVRFTGSPDFAFQPPPVAPSPSEFPPTYPNAQLKMRFEGYIRSEEFKRQWEILPTGELHYRNPGADSANLDDPRHFLAWLNSLPNLRIGYAKAQQGQPGELVFALRPLLDALRKADLCQP